MWKRDDEKSDKEKKEMRADQSDPGRETGAGAERRGGRRGVEQATIGSSIKIRGEVAGDEDLVIQGHVDGSVDLDQNAVTVGPDGEVTADITGRIITVEGSVEGDLTAEEQIVLRSSARVKGDISAPRVVLEDGARFRGGVEMGEAAERSRRAERSASRKSKEKASGESKTRKTAGSGSVSGSGKETGGDGEASGDGD